MGKKEKERERWETQVRCVTGVELEASSLGIVTDSGEVVTVISPLGRELLRLGWYRGVGVSKRD